MPWYAWAAIVWIAVDRLVTVGLCGRRPVYQIKVTPAFAVTSLISGALFVWCVVSLAGAA